MDLQRPSAIQDCSSSVMQPMLKPYPAFRWFIGNVLFMATEG